MPPSFSARQRLISIVQKNVRRKFKPVVEAAKTKKRWNIVRGDTVQVIGTHKERGKQGIVKEVIRKIDRLVVEGVNMGKKFLKGDPERGIPGGKMIEKERSIPYWSVMLLDPVLNVPTRVTRKYMEDGSRVRVSKKSGAIIPKPALSLIIKNKIRSHTTDKCTLEEDVWESTYVPRPPLKPRLQLPLSHSEEEDQPTDGPQELNHDSR